MKVRVGCSGKNAREEARHDNTCRRRAEGRPADREGLFPTILGHEGAGVIVGVAINPARRAMAESFGMTLFVNPRQVEGDLESAHPDRPGRRGFLPGYAVDA